MDVALKWENVRTLLSLHPFKAPKYVNNKREKVFTRLASYLQVKKRSNQMRYIYPIFSWILEVIKICFRFSLKGKKPKALAYKCMAQVPELIHNSQV